MNAKTKLLLYRLLWLAEKPLFPNYLNVTQSFEGWAYCNGLLGQIHRLEAQGFLERLQDPASNRRLHRLTKAGCALTLNGGNPETEWAREWDQKWRLILFDIPSRENMKRRQLTRALAGARCGCLQGSVWIAPMTSPKIEKLVKQDDRDCTHLLLLLADSKGPKVDARMVAGAWDFNAINAAYRKLQLTLDRFSEAANHNTRDALAKWTAEEYRATHEALRIDPLLPSDLLPKSYLGKKVWKNRCKVLAMAARLATTLKSDSLSHQKEPDADIA